MFYIHLVFLTPKSTKDTKVSDDRFSELRALRILRGENIFTIIPPKPSIYSPLHRFD